jgi:hypothetical protein
MGEDSSSFARAPAPRQLCERLSRRRSAFCSGREAFRSGREAGLRRNRGFARSGPLCEESTPLRQGVLFSRRGVPWLLALGFALLGYAAYRYRVGSNVGEKPRGGPNLQDLVLQLEGAPVERLEVSAFAHLADGRFGAREPCPGVPGAPARAKCSLRSGRYWIVGRAEGSARFALRAEAREGEAVRTLQVQLEKAHALKVEIRRKTDTDQIVPHKDATVLIRGRAGTEPLSVASGETRAAADLPFGALTDEQGKAAFVDLGPPLSHSDLCARLRALRG